MDNTLTCNIKAIIFDLGNVLIDFDHMIAARRIAPFTDKSPQEIFNLFFNSPVTALFEAGKISPADFFLKIKEMLGLRLDYAGFLPIWNEIFFLSDKNKAVYELAGALRTRYKTALVSNVNILHMEYLKKNFPVFDAFDCIITSFETGFQKPAFEIYAQALEALRVDPCEAFYTDDRIELIEGSRRLGIRGFVFTGLQQLKQDLRETGVNLQ